MIYLGSLSRFIMQFGYFWLELHQISVIKLKMVTLAQLNSFPNILDKPIHFQMFQG